MTFLTNAKNSVIFFLITLILTSCTQKKKFDFHGKWQSLNENGFVIDIKGNDNYTLYRDGRSMFSNVGDFKQLKIKIEEENSPWYRFKIFGENNQEEFGNGRMEIVNPERIRIYFHKHHDILDLADEFHRTENLISFDSIMGKIMKTPEK